jgi:hypothetical protein
MARDPTGTAVYDPENPLTRTWTGKAPRPSPRTGSTGVGIQKFGIQQLKMLDTGGVIEKDVGARTRLAFIESAGGGGGITTPFSQQYQQQRPATIRTQAQLETSPHAIPLLPDFGDFQFPDLTKLFPPASPNGETCTDCDSDKCKECNAWDVGCELGHMFAGTCTPPEKPPDEECDLGCLLTFRGCDCGCKDVKPCTTCDSTVCKECNAWDLQCEDCKKKDGTCTPPRSEECGCLPYDFGCEIGCWWEKNKNYVYLIGGLIGLGVLLWLLRPLFGIAKNITET